MMHVITILLFNTYPSFQINRINSDDVVLFPCSINIFSFLSNCHASIQTKYLIQNFKIPRYPDDFPPITFRNIVHDDIEDLFFIK